MRWAPSSRCFMFNGDQARRRRRLVALMCAMVSSPTTRSSSSTPRWAWFSASSYIFQSDTQIQAVMADLAQPGDSDEVVKSRAVATSSLSVQADGVAIHLQPQEQPPDRR